jgi:hypothetical protein
MRTDVMDEFTKQRIETIARFLASWDYGENAWETLKNTAPGQQHYLTKAEKIVEIDPIATASTKATSDKLLEKINSISLYVSATRADADRQLAYAEGEIEEMRGILEY